jgi:hypothetical protein
MAYEFKTLGSGRREEFEAVAHRPFKRVVNSLWRHLEAREEGDRAEDRLAAVAWHAFALMLYEEAIVRGRPQAELADIPEVRAALEAEMKASEGEAPAAAAPSPLS